MSAKRMPPAVAEAVIDRADGWCECLVPGVCTGRVEHLHHRQMRSQGGPHTVENLGGICAADHDFIHKHHAWAYEHGWLVHGWDTPSWPPVYFRGRMTTREEEDSGDDQAGARS